MCWSCVQEGKDIPIPIRARAINGPLEYDTIEFLRENSPWSTLRDTAPAESTPKSTGGAAVTGDSNSGQDSESGESDGRVTGGEDD